MIVCNCCGSALPALKASCQKCSGRGIERPTPLKGFLTPSQQRGSPDRWAKNYTASPPTAPSKTPKPGDRARPLDRASTHNSTFDIHPGPATSELTRVYGCVLDRRVTHPQCLRCKSDIRPRAKSYLARHDVEGFAAKDDVLCRGCFTEGYSLGMCSSCLKPIIGDHNEGYGGLHVNGRVGAAWHAACFRCTTCHCSLFRRDHELLLSGAPSCLECSDATTTITGGATVLHAVPRRKYGRPGEVQPLPTAVPTTIDTTPTRDHLEQTSLARPRQSSTGVNENLMTCTPLFTSRSEKTFPTQDSITSHRGTKSVFSANSLLHGLNRPASQSRPNHQTSIPSSLSDLDLIRAREARQQAVEKLKAIAGNAIAQHPTSQQFARKYSTRIETTKTFDAKALLSPPAVSRRDPLGLRKPGDAEDRGGLDRA